MLDDNNNNRYQESKTLNYNEVVRWKVAEDESNDKVR